MTEAPTLVARDPRTYRRRSLTMSRAADTANPDLWASLIAHTADTIAREWVRHYGVPFPYNTAVWTVEREHPADRNRRAETIKEIA